MRPGLAAGPPLLRAWARVLQLFPAAARRIGLLHRRHVDRRWRGVAHLAVPERRGRCTRRPGHPGADGHRRSDDHMFDLRPALLNVWNRQVAQETSLLASCDAVTCSASGPGSCF